MNKGAGRGKGRGSPEMGCGAQGVPNTPQGLPLPGWDARRCQDHRCAAHTGIPARVPLHPRRCWGPGQVPALWTPCCPHGMRFGLGSSWCLKPTPRPCTGLPGHTLPQQRTKVRAASPDPDVFKPLGCSMLSRALQNGPWRKRSSPRPGEPPGPAASPLLGLVAATSLSTNKVLPTSNALKPLCPPFLSMTTFWDIFSMPNLAGKAFFLLSMSPPNHHMIPGPIAWGITPGEGQQSSQSWDQQTPAPGSNSRQDRQEKPVCMKEGFCSSAPPAQRSGVLFLQSFSRAGLSRPPLLPRFGRGPRSGDKCPRPARCCCGHGALCCHLCRGCKKEETGMQAPRCQLHFH